MHVSIAQSRLPLLQLDTTVIIQASWQQFQSLSRDYLFCNLNQSQIAEEAGVPLAFQSLSRDYLFCNLNGSATMQQFLSVSIAQSRLPLLQRSATFGWDNLTSTFQSLSRDFLFCNGCHSNRGPPWPHHCFNRSVAISSSATIVCPATSLQLHFLS